MGNPNRGTHPDTRCDAQLPANWGCADSEWGEELRLCDYVPRRFLTRPCPVHEEATP